MFALFFRLLCFISRDANNCCLALLAPTNVVIKPDPKTGIVSLNWQSSVDRFLVEVDTGIGFKRVWEGASKLCALEVVDPCAFNVRVYSVSNTTPPRHSEPYELRSFVPGNHSVSCSAFLCTNAL
jgi:hypothetical protein